jgi:hypothetical protein
MLIYQEWQHQARTKKVTTDSVILHLFNDYNDEFATNPSNGLLLYVDIQDRNISLIQAFEDPSDVIYSTSQGSYDALSNGNVLIGYGDIPTIKEFGSDGSIRMTIDFGLTAQCYRAYRQMWEATPAYAPAVVGSQGKGWVSWNGDTRTTQWVIYTGTSNSSMVSTVNRTGFETEFNITNGSTWLQVGAFSGGTFLRNSSVVTVV